MKDLKSILKKALAGHASAEEVREALDPGAISFPAAKILPSPVPIFSSEKEAEQYLNHSYTP